MEIQLSVAVTESFGTNQSVVLHELSQQLNQFISGKSYGNDVQKIKVGFIMILSRPGYEQWYKPKKLSYVYFKISKSKLTGEIVEINKQISFEIRLDENSIGSFLNATKTEAQRLILQEVLNYLSQMKTLPGKITDFDKEGFLNDLREFQNNLAKS